MDLLHNDLGDFGLVACAAAMLLLRVGMGLYAVGLVRAKNAAGTILRGLTDVCLAALIFWAIGFALFDPLGLNGKFLPRTLSPYLGFDFHYLLGGAFLVPDGGGTLAGTGLLGPMVCLLAATLLGSAVVVGGLAERAKFFPSLAVTALLAGLVIPLAGHWAWFGWLRGLGLIDAGGAAIFHLPGAVTAAVGAGVVGASGQVQPRRLDQRHPRPQRPPRVVRRDAHVRRLDTLPAGTGRRAQGGAGAAGIALNVVMAAAAAGMAGLIFAQLRYRKPDVHVAHAGLLGGLVAITAGATVVASWQAVVIGAVAGVLVPYATAALDLTWKMDDPGGGVSVHGVGAAWGLIAAGLFRAADSFRDWIVHVGVQVLGLLAVAALALLAAVGLFALLGGARRLRVRDADEYDGLDVAEHDASAYPDFHQSMIKSY